MFGFLVFRLSFIHFSLLFLDGGRDPFCIRHMVDHGKLQRISYWRVGELSDGSCPAYLSEVRGRGANHG